MMPHNYHMYAYWLLLPLMLFLAACDVMSPVEPITDVQYATPQEVVTTFFTDIQNALNDPTIVEPSVRDMWTERLAHYFAPTERVTQRTTFGWMLAHYAYDSEQLEANQLLIYEITYSDIHVVDEQPTTARVAIVDGTITLKHMRVEPNGTQTLRYSETMPLSDILGNYSHALPVLRVHESWYLTEWDSHT